MQNLRTATLATLTLVGLFGCKNVKIDNGEVPSQYMSQAIKLEGTYHGSFNGVHGDLVIDFKGNRPEVSFRNGNGGDILNNNCASDIGLLQQVTIRGENRNPRVSSATFGFSPGRCSLMVQGREFVVGFKEKNDGYTLNVSIVQDSQTRDVCTWDPGAPPNVPPRQECHPEIQTSYLTGSFSK
jgi:hypothetical protein